MHHAPIQAKRSDFTLLAVPPRRRGAGPREHGRQAARSVRDRPRDQTSKTTDPAMSAPRKRRLDPKEPYSATHAP